MNFKKTWKRANDGFTLVELIVVIAILAILAGIAVPAYSGYIKKANKAADLQLLGAVNTAFAAAAMDADNISISSQPDGSYGFNTNTMLPTNAYVDEFKLYFAGNTGTFKEIGQLVFEGGSFKDAADSDKRTPFKFNDNTVYLSKEDLGKVNDLLDSSGLTVDGLMDDVDGLSGLAATFTGVFADEDFQKSAAAAMGCEVSELEAKAQALADQKGVSKDVILGNSVVMYAAQGAADVSADSVKALVNGGDIYGALMATGKDRGDAVSEAAMLYGMYTIYASNNALSVDTTDPMTVLENMSSDANFTAYINGDTQYGNAETDMDAYRAALNMINESTSSSSTMTDVLTGGFNDKNLVDAINGVLNSVK